MSMISCIDLWKVYGSKMPASSSPADVGVAALKNASFEVEAGECFVIMGLSGSGKSTLIRCLTRLIEPSRGRVLIEGQDLTKASSRELLAMRRKYMGMVFQHFALLPHLNVIDNIAFPLAVRGLEQQERRARAGDLAATVGLAGREHYFPSQLSGGQQQRVGIARALASDPHVLFMDEPFSALDPLLRRELQTEFMRLRQQLKKTIVFITHDFDEAIRLADRIAIMKDGEILEIGTPEELIVHSVHPYVREFTQHADRKNIVRVRTLAKPGEGGILPSIMVPADRLVSEVASQIVMAKEPVGVTENGRCLGVITPADVLRVLTDDDLDGRAMQ